MSDFNINLPGAPVGWQCPVCKRIYSPYTPMCYYCGGEETASSDSQITYRSGTSTIKPEGLFSDCINETKNDPADQFLTHNYGYFNTKTATEKIINEL